MQKYAHWHSKRPLKFHFTYCLPYVASPACQIANCGTEKNKKKETKFLSNHEVSCWFPFDSRNCSFDEFMAPNASWFSMNKARQHSNYCQLFHICFDSRHVNWIFSFVSLFFPRATDGRKSNLVSAKNLQMKHLLIWTFPMSISCEKSTRKSQRSNESMQSSAVSINVL